MAAELRLLLEDGAVGVGVGGVLAHETLALAVDEDAGDLRCGVRRGVAGGHVVVDGAAHAGELAVYGHAHADAVAVGQRRDVAHLRGEVPVLLLVEAHAEVLGAVNAPKSQDDALGRLDGELCSVALDDGAHDALALGEDEALGGRVVLERGAQALGLGGLGVGQHAALAASAAALVHVDAVGVQALGDVGHMAVAVDADPLDADGGQPFDELRGTVAHRGDEVLVANAFGLLHVALGMLLGRVVLEIGEFLLPLGACGLDDAARHGRGAARLLVGVHDDDLGASLGCGAGSGQAGTAGAQDEDVALLVPRFRLFGGLGGADEAVRDGEGCSSSSACTGDKVPASQFGHGKSPFNEMGMGALDAGPDVRAVVVGRLSPNVARKRPIDHPTHEKSRLPRCVVGGLSWGNPNVMASGRFEVGRPPFWGHTC